MPVHRVSGGYRYGETGKVYKTRGEAERQGRAIRASQARAGKSEGVSSGRGLGARARRAMSKRSAAKRRK